MPTTHKVLGQSAPVADTDTTLYTVPASTEVVTSTFTAANRGTVSAKFRLAIRPNGAVIANQHYIYYDIDLPAGETFASTIGMTMDASDVVTVRADTADVSFNLFGQEIT